MENYLFHHGIKGQKWGVRRFQNEDGTLTNDGRKRYGNEKIKDTIYKKSPYVPTNKGIGLIIGLSLTGLAGEVAISKIGAKYTSKALKNIGREKVDSGTLSLLIQTGISAIGILAVNKANKKGKLDNFRSNLEKKGYLTKNNDYANKGAIK